MALARAWAYDHGKTRLLTHACEQAAQAGMTVLAARAAEFEDGYAWGVVRQLFEAEIRADGGQRLADDAVALAAMALTRDAQRGAEDPFAVLRGLYWLTSDIAQQAPLLLAVDDLHWADQPSQRFVAHLAHRLEGLAVLLVLTVREPRSGPAQQKSLIAGLAAEASVIALRPAALGAAACAELARGTLGVDPSPAFQDACRELTGGNPLLLRGLLASLAAEGVKGTDAEVPHLRRLTPGSVSRSVLLQLGRMSAAALAAARAVAVLGTAATAERAGRLAGLDGDASAEAIGALMAERFIEGERALRFVHPLVRSAVYQDLAPPVRQRWRSARRWRCPAASPTPLKCCKRPSVSPATIGPRSPLRYRPPYSMSHAGTSIADRSCGRYLSGCRRGPKAARTLILSCTPTWRLSSARPAWTASGRSAMPARRSGRRPG